MRCGSQVASNGKTIRMTRRMRSVATNGSTPLKIVENDTSLTTLLMTKTFMPTGGWIRPSAPLIPMMTPNQIGAKPRCASTGEKIRHVENVRCHAAICDATTAFHTLAHAHDPEGHA